MKKYNHYDDNPLKLLWDTRKHILPKYIWKVWIAIGVFILVLIFFNLIDLRYISSNSFIDSSISGLSFTLVIVSAAIEIFEKDELVILIKSEKNVKVPGEEMLGLLTPYLFTAILFLFLGIISLISPYITIEFSSFFNSGFNFIYIMLILLSLFSLFNITFTILNDLYYKIIRESKEK